MFSECFFVILYFKLLSPLVHLFCLFMFPLLESMTVVFYYHSTHFVGEVILEIVMLYTFLEFGIKETVQRDFRPPFFHYSNLHGPLIDGLKYFRF